MEVNVTELNHHCGYPTKVIKEYEKVFVIAALWDYNYYHFMVDSLSKYTLPLLNIDLTNDLFGSSNDPPH